MKYDTYTIQQVCSSALIDDGLESLAPNFRLTYHYQLDTLCRQLTATLRVPARVLQDRAVIAEYPDGLWQHVRKTLGLKYRSHQVLLTEWLVFPSVTVPPYEKNVRVVTFVSPLLNDPFAKESDDYT